MKFTTLVPVRLNDGRQVPEEQLQRIVDELAVQFGGCSVESGSMAKSKAQQALEFVRQTAEAGGSAIDVHDAFFGNGGKFHELFPARAQREDFLRTPEYQEICRIRNTLRQAEKAPVS